MIARRNLIKILGLLIPVNIFGLEALASQPEYTQSEYDKLYLKWKPIIDYSGETCKPILDNLSKFKCMREMQSVETALVGETKTPHTSNRLTKMLIPMIRRKYSKDLPEPLNDMNVIVSGNGIRISVVDDHTPIHISITNSDFIRQIDYMDHIDDVYHYLHFNFTDENGVAIFTDCNFIYPYWIINSELDTILVEIIKEYKKKYTGLL